MTKLPKNPDGTTVVDGHIFASGDERCIHCGMTLRQYKDGPKICEGGSETIKGLTVED
jgi:hypothetical protein